MKLVNALLLTFVSSIAFAQEAIIIDEVTTTFGRIVLLPKANDGSRVELLFYQDEQKPYVFSDVAYSDLTFETIPSLVNKPDTNSFVIKNQGCCGNVHWNKAITISYRNEELLVSGYTFSSGEFNPSEDPDAEALLWKTCDVNLVTGDYSLTEAGETSKGQAKPEVMPLADNLADFFPEICGPFIGG